MRESSRFASGAIEKMKPAKTERKAKRRFCFWFPPMLAHVRLRPPRRRPRLPRKRKIIIRLRRQPLHGTRGAPSRREDDGFYGENCKYRGTKKEKPIENSLPRRHRCENEKPQTHKKNQSTYLDRLITVDEKNYLFSVTLYVHLSWTDPRAFAAVANATARMNEKSAVGDGGAGCDRPCSGQEMRHELSKCFDTLWLPSLVFRNIAEYPQGRAQPYSIKARESGVVTWRIEVSFVLCCDPFFLLRLDSFSPPSKKKKKMPEPDACRSLYINALRWLPVRCAGE